jgi:signal-transduction protein with cAMP-binding, CBS, and nucleotidyltransferase domain
MSTSGRPEMTPVADPVRQRTVGDLMRPATMTVETRAHLAAVAYLMNTSGDSALVVTTDGSTRAPLGVITDRDITQAVARDQDLETVRISDLLPRQTITVAPSTPVDEAIRLMLEMEIHHLPVVNEGGVVGIVDLMDVCRAMTGAA